MFAFVCVLIMELYISLQNVFLAVYRYLFVWYNYVVNTFHIPDVHPITNAPPANLIDLPRQHRTRYGLRNVIRPPRRY